jgi:hypothetical protein
MIVRRAVVGVASTVAVLALISGCGSGDAGPSGVGTQDAPAAAASAPQGAIEILAGAPGAAAAAGCDATRDTLELAVVAYVALHGAAPTDQSDLIDAQVVREPTPWFDIAADGEIRPSPGSPCS